MTSIRHVGAAEVKRVLEYKHLLPGVERSLAAFSNRSNGTDGVVQPLRTQLNIHDHNGRLMVMPGYLPGERALATKVLSVFPDNSRAGISTHHALVLLMKPETGEVEAIIDGESITELRTAAASGVASKYLAPETAKKVGIIGAGVQARSHARVHHFLFNPDEIAIWSRTSTKTKELVDQLKKEGVKAVCAESAEEAARNADIINTCTLSSTPVLWAGSVKKGAHINVVGAVGVGHQEIDPSLMTSSVVYTDSIDAAKIESGDVIMSGAQIYAEIGDVINSTKKARKDELTVFKSLGIAVLDAISARLTIDLLDIEKSSLDTKILKSTEG